MDNVIYFNSKKISDSYDVDSLCVFFGEKACQDILNFYSALEEGLKSCKILPDSMVIICSKEQAVNIRSYWEDTEHKNNFLNRTIISGTRYTKEFYFVELNNTNCSLNSDISVAGGITNLTNNDITQLIIHGLNNLIEKNQVVHQAPAGHTFKHPSGKKSKLFIQAREMAKTEVEVQFIARAICILSPKLNWRELDTIYIDSMGIYPFVKQCLTYTNSFAEIVSFHSYDEIEAMVKPQGKSAVIVSASTSGNMAKKLNSKGWQPQELITLIDMDKRPAFCYVIASLKKILSVSEGNIDGWETDIELVGEHFSYKAKPPKQITIGIPHNPEYLQDILSTFKIDGINQLNSQTNTKNQVISLNPEKLIADAEFKKWLKQELKWSMPVSVNFVVHANDEPSKNIAEQTKAIIEELHGYSLNLLSSVKLDKNALLEATGVLVVSAFTGDGGVLRQISRDLREFEPNIIPRHFLAGVGIPQSMSSWKRLKQFLVRNATSRSYKFSTWKVLAIGSDNIANSWNQLTTLAAQAQTKAIKDFCLHECSEQILTESLDDLCDAINDCQNSFLPNFSGDPLKITDGFLFFGNIYSQQELTLAPQQDVLLTVASVLQAAREHSNPENCLSPSNYQSVIIAPETFLRFNDDILQACILRACLPSELDYSSDSAMSEIMTEFISKLFDRNEHSFGYSALEFAAALAIGKLKLKDDHLKDLVSTSIKNLSDKKSVLLGMLMMASLG